MPKVKQATTKTPEQQQLIDLINQGLKDGTGPFADIFGQFDQEEFDKGVTQPALKNFQENILPSVQEKFIAGNQTGGSGMRRGLAKAGTDLQSKLAALMYEAQQGQKQNRIAGVTNQVNGQNFENIVKQPKPGFWETLLPVAGKVAGDWVTSASGNNNNAAAANAVAG